MLRVVPNYYDKFQCIAGACRHNCCIGWEIDIDEAAAARYQAEPGEIGERLRSQIDWSEEPHFILGEKERCPFLNKKGLCDLITTLGEASLCEICAEHPRFHNELPGRIETGLGLCCEAAGRLILGMKEPMRLCLSGEAEEEDEIVALRDELLAILQDRTQPIRVRVETMLARCGAASPDADWESWADFLLELERLDEDWTKRLMALRGEGQHADLDGFDAHMAERQTEYEQFLVYLLYRHFANGEEEEDLAARASFAVFGYELLHRLGAVQWTRTGEFSFDDQVELARLISSELEYSTENQDAILDELFESFH